MKSFLFANVPLSVLHFILFLIFGGFLGQPGFIVWSSTPSSGVRSSRSSCSRLSARYSNSPRSRVGKSLLVSL